ncbi:uncharacterized protein MONOS_10341 [Monocercomonoides exilis]|uniref:uncharacterized protein n=1 Tax=Monocercomonoides exilis TaxID=2049356 RepID=UPI003559F127|nr:hypothetical protein MONOS_10341 [Monocercomonoides exilis]|eukprot:MONOS_10341.1-p1 / transcript=MONOS_10341.1 / gene=MONOS_10341 / organism=Monocercomonoides_exilis_PA203 / gene_product=unspecified product / transcript_product=unspecified product / location=Mono_scaffold00466:8101-12156(+) / protein_length=1308 / sequence_SO=supercontig / SO=protein_coding / is_pseudo=false
MAGGAVFLRGAINFVCENSSFLMCHATWQGGCGGGIFADRIDGQATFDKGSFMRCRAGKCGGGMFFSFEKTKLKQHKSENMEAAEMIEMTVTQNWMSIVFQLSNVFNEFTASHFHFYYVAFKHNKELDYNSREKELFDDITPTNNDRNEDNEAAFGSFRAFNSEFMSQLQFMCNCSQLSDKPRINVLFWDAVGVWNPVGDFKPCDHSCWFGKRDGDAILLQKNAVTDVSSWLKNVTFFYIGGEDAIDSPACGMLQSLPCASLEPALNGRCEYETSLYIIGDVAPIKSQLLFFQERITFMVYKGVKPIEIHSRLQEQESVFSLFGTELVMMYASFYFGKSQVDSMVSFCYQHSIFSDKNVFLSFSSFNLTGPNAESSSGAMTTTFFYNPMFVIYNAGLSISDSTISHFSFSESPLISLRGKHYNLMLALAVFNDISTRKSQSAIVKINQTKADSSPLQFVCANSTFKSIKATSSNSGGAMDLLTNFYGDISLKHTAFQECEAEQTEFGRGGALFCTCDNLHATPLLKSMIFQDNLANCANDIFIICDSFTQINSSTISFEYSHCSVNEANSFMGRLKNKLDIVNLLPQIICYEAETIFTSSTHENASDEEKCGSLKLPCKTMDVASTHVNHTTLGRLLIIGNASIGRSSQLINTEISSFSDENSYFIFNNTMITTNVLTCSENVVFSSLYFLFDSCKLQNDESIFFVNGPTNISSSTFQQIESSSMNFDFQRLSSNEKQYLGIILLSVFETQLTLHDIRFIDFTVNKPLFLFYFNTSITMRNITFSSIELNETSIVQSVHNNNQPSIADFPIYSSMEDSISSFRYSLFRRQSDKSFSLMSVSRFDNDNSIQDINMKNIAFTNLSLSNSTLIFLDFPKTYSNTSFSMKEIKLSNIKLLSQQENPLFVYCKNNNFAIYQIYLDISDLFVSNCSVPKISGSLILASNVSFQLKYSQIMNQRLSQGTSCSKLQLTDKVKRSESIPQSLKSNQEVIRNGIERWKEEEEEEAADSICLWNTSIIQMKNCTSIVDNVQISGFSVGAFIIQGGTANITSCQFLNNSATENDMLISRNIVCRDNASIDFVNVTTSATDDSLWIVNEGCTFSGAFSTEEIFFAHPSLSNMTFDSQNGTCFLHFVGNNILPCNMTFSFVEYSKQPTEFIIDGTLTEFQGSTAAVGVIGQKTMSRIQYEHPNAAAAIVCWGANPLKNMTSNPIRLFSITPRDTPHFPTKIVVSIAVSVVFVIVCIIILSFIIASKWKRRKKKTGKACVDSGVFSVNRSNLISDTSQLLPTESIPSDVQEPNFEEDDEDFI